MVGHISTLKFFTQYVFPTEISFTHCVCYVYWHRYFVFLHRPLQANEVLTAWSSTWAWHPDGYGTQPERQAAEESTESLPDGLIKVSVEENNNNTYVHSSVTYTLDHNTSTTILNWGNKKRSICDSSHTWTSCYSIEYGNKIRARFLEPMAYSFHIIDSDR